MAAYRGGLIMTAVPGQRKPARLKRADVTLSLLGAGNTALVRCQTSGVIPGIDGR